MRNKVDNTSKILGVICFMLAIAFIVVLISISYQIINQPTGSKEVKCYDNYDNVIVGEVCIETITNIEKVGQTMVISIAFIFFICVLSYVGYDFLTEGI